MAEERNGGGSDGRQRGSRSGRSQDGRRRGPQGSSGNRDRARAKARADREEWNGAAAEVRMHLHSGGFTDHPDDDRCVLALVGAVNTILHKMVQRNIVTMGTFAALLRGELDAARTAEFISRLPNEWAKGQVLDAGRYQELIDEAEGVLRSQPYPTSELVEQILDLQGMGSDAAALVKQLAESSGDAGFAKAIIARALRDRKRGAPSVEEEILRIGSRNRRPTHQEVPSSDPAQAEVVQVAQAAAQQCSSLFSEGRGQPESVTADAGLVVIRYGELVTPTTAKFVAGFVREKLADRSLPRDVDVQPVRRS